VDPTHLGEAPPRTEKTTMVLMAIRGCVGGNVQQLPRWLGLPDCERQLNPRDGWRKLGIEVLQPRFGPNAWPTSMHSAVQKRRPWFGYYWGPTTPLGKFDIDQRSAWGSEEIEAGANSQRECRIPRMLAVTRNCPQRPYVTSCHQGFPNLSPEGFRADVQRTSSRRTKMSSLAAWDGREQR